MVILDRTSFFRPNTMFAVINWVGWRLLLIYIIAMFIVPWLRFKNWDSVQAVWDRWQTLNAGALAFLASVLAFNCSIQRKCAARAGFHRC